MISDPLPPSPDSVPDPLTPPEATLRQALADLETLDQCLQGGESVAPGRTAGVAMQRLRTLYLLAVEDEARVDQADGFRADLLAGGEAPETRVAEREVVQAYEGALEVLRSKHAFWPSTRMRHLRSGLSILDEGVAHHPRNVEIRYLRLVSTAFLPGILGRTATAREDLAVLVHLLPSAVDGFPARTYAAMVGTVVELLADRGEDPPEALVEALARAHELDRPLAPGCEGG